MSPKLSSDETDLLYWAFDKNQWFSSWFADKSSVPTCTWFDYTNLLSSIHNLPIYAVQEKLSNVGNPSKLLSTLSELQAAKVFAEKDFEVELLLDNDSRFKRPPDLFAYRRGSKLLVEVARMSRDEAELALHQKLYPLLKELDFVVTVFYSRSLSKFVLKAEERSAKERLFYEFVEKLQQRLKSLDKSQLPCNFALEDSKISVKLAEPGRGRISITAPSWTRVPLERYVQQIQKIIVHKASKRIYFTEDFLEQPFLIFLDLGNASEIYEAIFPALYGSRTLIEGMKPNEIALQRVLYPKFVLDRLQGCQSELLVKLGFDSRRHIHIDECGYFVTQESVRENVTGVLTMLDGKVECYPNPFCDELIFLPNLSEYLDMPLVSTGIDEITQSKSI